MYMTYHLVFAEITFIFSLLTSNIYKKNMNGSTD